MATLDAWSTILSHTKPEGAAQLGGDSGTTEQLTTGAPQPTRPVVSASTGGASVHFAPPHDGRQPSDDGTVNYSPQARSAKDALSHQHATTENPSANVLWQSPVEKIGRNLQSHSRVAMVADESLYVCLQAGGITRTIPLAAVRTIRVIPPCVAQVSIAEEPDLVLSMPSTEVRANFLSAVQRGKPSDVNSVALNIFETSALTAEYGGSILRPVNNKTNDSLLRHSSLLGTSTQHSQEASGGQHDVAVHDESELFHNQSPAFDDRHDLRKKQMEDMETAADSHLTVDVSSSMYSLQAQVDTQQRVIEQLQRKTDDSKIVDELRRDLEHSRSLTTDLQTALRAQEDVFQEMLRGQEALRVAEDIKSSQEKQLNLMREEKKAWKQVVQGKDREIATLNDTIRLKQIEHEDELAQIRRAFVDYDANVATYLEGLRTGNSHIQMPITTTLPRSVPQNGSHRSVSGGGSVPLGGVGADSELVDVSLRMSEPYPQYEENFAVDQTGDSTAVDTSALSVHTRPFGSDKNGGHSSESESLQNNLVDRLNKYANRKYHLPRGHPAPGNVPTNRYPVGYSSPAVSHGTAAATPRRLRDRSIL